MLECIGAKCFTERKSLAINILAHCAGARVDILVSIFSNIQLIISLAILPILCNYRSLTEFGPLSAHWAAIYCDQTTSQFKRTVFSSLIFICAGRGNTEDRNPSCQLSKQLEMAERCQAYIVQDMKMAHLLMDV